MFKNRTNSRCLTSRKKNSNANSGHFLDKFWTKKNGHSFYIDRDKENSDNERN